MWPKWHLLYSFVFAFILVYFFNFSILAGSIVFLAAILIDLDHILVYAISTKDVNPLRFWSWSKTKSEEEAMLTKEERSNLKKPHFILHGIEFLAIIILLSFFHEIFLFMLIGFIFHLILDYLAMVYEKEHFALKTSQIWLWFRNRNKKVNSF